MYNYWGCRFFRVLILLGYILKRVPKTQGPNTRNPVKTGIIGFPGYLVSNFWIFGFSEFSRIGYPKTLVSEFNLLGFLRHP